jgi:hypothetical protein
MLERLLIARETVRTAATERERSAVFRFRYSVYVTELGKTVASADHSRREIHDPEDDLPGSTLFYTGSEEEMTGTLRVQLFPSGQVPDGFSKRFSLDLFPGIADQTVAEAGRLLVSKTLRGKLVLPALARAGLAHLHAAGVFFNFCYCAPGLVRPYRRLGYRPYSCELINTADGLRVPMVLVTSDLQYLKRAHSPLAAQVAEVFGVGKRAPLDLSPYASLLGTQAVIDTDADSVWRQVEEELLQEDHPPVFLENVPASAARRLAEKGFVMDVPADRVVTRSELQEREVFLILDGLFEVAAEGRRLALLHKGEIFGEVAFFNESGRRTASVRSLMPGRVMVLRRRFLEELIEEDPRAATQILINLGRILAARLASMIPHDR